MGILIDSVCAFIEIFGLKACWKEDVWWSIETGRYPCLLYWWPYNHFETWSRYSRHRGETNLLGIPTDWRQWTVTIGHTSLLWEKEKWAGLALDDGFGCSASHPIMIFTKLTGSCSDPLSTKYPDLRRSNTYCKSCFSCLPRKNHCTQLKKHIKTATNHILILFHMLESKKCKPTSPALCASRRKEFGCWRRCWCCKSSCCWCSQPDRKRSRWF